MKTSLKLFASVFFIFIALHVEAQHKNFGLNIAYENSKNLVQEADAVPFQNGRSFHSLYAGIYYEKSPSKGQTSRKTWLNPFIVFELGGCWCGGYFNLPRTAKDSEKEFEEFEYLVYRAEFAVIGGFRVDNFKFLLGPEVVHPFYNARKREDDSGYTENSSEYENASLGLNIGVGYEISFLRFDIRYQRLLTSYGERFRDKTFEFSEKQWRFTVGVRLFKRNKEKNLKSIFWE